MHADCVVVAGGELSHEEELRRLARLGVPVVCADSGLDRARTAGVVPRAAVGDFDSASPEALAWAEAEGAAIERHPVAKDATDAELALDWCARRGAQRIALFGAAGRRLDQTIATALLLTRFEASGIEVLAHAPGWKYRALVPGKEPARWRLPCARGALFSLVPLDETASGVTVVGARYPLRLATLARSSTLATSNEAEVNGPLVEVAQGPLLVLVEA